METHVFSFGKLFWSLFNLVLLIAVFAFLGWRVVRTIRRDVRSRAQKPEQRKNAKPLGETIRDHRNYCNMTQEFVAESLGVSRQAVSKWESGAAIPSTTNLLALARLFQVEAEELLRGGKEEKQCIIFIPVFATSPQPPSRFRRTYSLSRATSGTTSSTWGAMMRPSRSFPR